MSTNNLLSNAVLMPEVVPRGPESLDVNTDTQPYIRLGWWVIVLGIGGFSVWAALAPLDKGVPLSGTVTVSSSKKAVQHLTGGVVESILVKEGDTVKAGDVLVRLNAVQAKANAEIVRVQYFSARITEARLMAERDNKKVIVFSPELQGARADPRVANNITLQQQLFNARQSAIATELSALDENIAGLLQQNKGFEQAHVGKNTQLTFLKEQLDNTRNLAKEGYVSRNQQLDLERSYSQLSTSASDDMNNISRSQNQISEFKLRRLQRQQEYQKEVRTQLSEVQKEADSLANRLAGLDYDLGSVLVKSPVDGTVVAMNIFTHGGVVAPGFRMMDIVPSSDALTVEGQLPVHLVDKVHPNLPVELMFTAFNQNFTPQIPGIVTQVSADRLVDEKSGQPYYSMKAVVAPEGAKLLAKVQLRPGMPVDMFIKTGERTMLNYLFKPLQDHFKMSMSEE
jgi:membrane fusion protein, protease secretion system